MDLPAAAVTEVLLPLGLTILWAFIGRLVWHIRKVESGERRFFSPHLIWELGLAVGVGIVADGVVAWLGLTGKPAVALIVVLSYLGPGGLERLFWHFAERWAPGAKT